MLWLRRATTVWSAPRREEAETAWLRGRRAGLSNNWEDGRYQEQESGVDKELANNVEPSFPDVFLSEVVRKFRSLLTFNRKLQILAL